MREELIFTKLIYVYGHRFCFKDFPCNCPFLNFSLHFNSLCKNYKIYYIILFFMSLIKNQKNHNTYWETLTFTTLHWLVSRSCNIKQEVQSRDRFLTRKVPGLLWRSMANPSFRDEQGAFSVGVTRSHTMDQQHYYPWMCPFRQHRAAEPSLWSLLSADLSITQPPFHIVPSPLICSNSFLSDLLSFSLHCCHRLPSRPTRSG